MTTISETDTYSYYAQMTTFRMSMTAPHVMCPHVRLP